MIERLRALRARLRQRPDSEHEQAIVRLAVGTILFCYLLPSAFSEDGVAARTDIALILAMVGYLAVAVAVLADIIVRPGVSPARRLIAAFVDIAAVTFFMVETDDHGAPLFLVYLWITLANGFRFGRRYLIASLVMSCVGFAMVLHLGEFWQKHLDIGAGLLVGFVAISLYVLTLVTRMSDALVRAEAANQAKRRFISMVSHEMRTPLNAIIGMTDLLEQSPQSRESAEMVQTISGSSRVLLSLVDDVLDFSKIEAGKLVLAPGDFDLHALVSGVHQMLSGQARAKGLSFKFQIDAAVPKMVKGDAHYVRQVLVNLVGNALKFTSEGGVSIVARRPETAEDRTRVRFEVRDTGIGIAPENQARIFESFTQADERISRRFGGTGLGTTIAKQLVELMGGRIGVQSALGVGSTFWLELPLLVSSVQASGPETAHRGTQVLLVGFRDPAPVARFLEEWSVAYCCAASEETALQHALAGDEGTRVSVIAYAETDGQARALASLVRRVAGFVPVELTLVAPAWVGRGASLEDADFARVIRTPVDKRLLFNAVHPTAAVASAPEVVSLGDFLRQRAAPHSYRVLVADDHAMNREVIARILQQASHTVHAVASGEQALDAIESGQFDLAVIDRNMPGMSGIEVAHAIRLMELGIGRLPLIMLSADVTTEAKAEAEAAGIDLFLTKPIQAGPLLDEIDRICRPRAERAGKRQQDVERADRLELPVLNMQTMELLEGLGSPKSDFIERLVNVFIVENRMLLEKMKDAAANAKQGELQGHIHAMKGAAVSIGTERLAQLCGSLQSSSSAMARLRMPQALRSIEAELDLAETALRTYLDRRSGRIRHGS
jgi:two-component system sensor histidine kinase RpfC